jgi:holo-[acyl-carrier protein] synthase
VFNDEFGIGIDIINISRFDDVELSENNPFLLNLFTSAELFYCLGKSNKKACLASKFAAKEAVIKATSSVYPSVLLLNEIEILNETNGKPYVLIRQKKSKSIFLSLSHSSTNAIAVAFHILDVMK